MKIKYRKSNLFEVIILIVGLAVMMIGFFFINKVVSANSSLGWEMLQTIFLWLMLIVLIVLLAVDEDVKEELGIIIKEHIEETRIMKEETQLLREISQEQLQELRLISGLAGREKLPKKKASSKKAKK